MAAAARVDGQEKVLAAAQHIVKSLATSKNAADDMIRILSGFDNRLSAINLFPPSSSPSPSVEPIPEELADPADPADAEPRSSAADAESRFGAAEQVVLRWDSSDSLLYEASPDEIAEYLAAADELTAFSESRSGSLHGRAESALQLAMARLEDEFRHLMIRNTVPLDASGLFCSLRRSSLSFASVSTETMEDLDNSTEFEQQEGNLDDQGGSSLLDDQNMDLIRPEAVTDLKGIADRMLQAGYGKELSQVYCSIRRDILDECLCILGAERLSIEEVQRIEQRPLDEKMKKWIQGVKTVVRALLSGERRLCDCFFAVSDELREECFFETAKGCVLQLLTFGDAIAICPRSPEKIFRILDMYEALAEVMPDLQALFPGDSGELICGEADGILKRLGDAIRGTLREFGNAVQRETSQRPMQAGDIHPMTRYVMNYLRLLVVYSEALDSLLEDGGVGIVDQGSHEAGDADDAQHLEGMALLGRVLLVLISYLEANLEIKSNLYEDGALQCVFMMNNILYVVHKVKDSELGRILGDHWIRRRRGKIRQHSKSYLRASWFKVISYLRDDGMSIKDRFKSFNLAFEEVYKIQTAWKVPDPQLREELKISISENLIPAYRGFMGRFASQIDGGRHAMRYIKYTAEDLESHLSDLFEGSSSGSGSSHSRRT